MAYFYNQRTKQAGLPPGTLLHVGRPRDHQVEISVIEYTEHVFREFSVASAKEIPQNENEDKLPDICWAAVSGIHQVEVVEAIGQRFHLHPLLLEDVVNSCQRPKLDEYDNCLYLVMKTLSYQEQERKIYSEQFSVVLMPRGLITFQEEEKSEVLEVIRERLRTKKGRVRRMDADYLAYTILDTVVDHYFLVLDKIGEQIGELENALDEDEPNFINRVHQLKRLLISFRKMVWPVREMIHCLIKEDTTQVADSTRLFLRDVHDHVVQLIEVIEMFRDILSGLEDASISNLSYRLNQTMKVLTSITTIFIPMSFIAGVYGMNFEFMPELHYRWAYPTVLSAMVIICIGMFYFFKKKKMF